MPRAPKVCPRCPNDQPCPDHTPKPWAGTRVSVPPATRRRILRRDHNTCQHCRGTRCGNQRLEIDHIVPVAEGGTDDDTNLQALGARPCHAEKTAAEIQRGQRRRTDR